MSDQQQPLVLITGGTGHLGYQVILHALQNGYSVRAAIRSEIKAASILDAPSLRSLNPGPRLSFIVVPDITVPGAYDGAVKDCSYIIHIASPLAGKTTSTDYEKGMIEPAVKGTLGILESASNVGSIKRVVVTSSILAIIPFAALTGPHSNEIIQATDRTVDEYGPFDFGAVQAYCASKVRALNASEAWMKERRPTFDLISVLSSYLIGRNELVTEFKDVMEGTNARVLSAVLGIRSPRALPGTTVSVHDVAKLHVLALDTIKIRGDHAYLATSHGDAGIVYNDALGIVARRFSKVVKNGVLKNDGDQPTRLARVDTKDTEEIFGMKFASFEDQVVSAVEHYVELALANKAAASNA